MASIGGPGRRDATEPLALLRQHRLAVLIDPESLAAVRADDFVHVSRALNLQVSKPVGAED